MLNVDGFEPFHLALEELEYELRIRGIDSKGGNYRVKSRFLSDALKRERDWGGSIQFVEWDSGFEMPICLKKSDLLWEDAKKAVSNNDLEALKVLVSRSNHAMHRVSRIVPKGQDQVDLQGHLLESFKHLRDEMVIAVKKWTKRKKNMTQYQLDPVRENASIEIAQHKPSANSTNPFSDDIVNLTERLDDIDLTNDGEELPENEPQFTTNGSRDRQDLNGAVGGEFIDETSLMSGLSIPITKMEEEIISRYLPDILSQYSKRFETSERLKPVNNVKENSGENEAIHQSRRSKINDNRNPFGGDENIQKAGGESERFWEKDDEIWGKTLTINRKERPESTRMPWQVGEQLVSRDRNSEFTLDKVNGSAGNNQSYQRAFTKTSGISANPNKFARSKSPVVDRTDQTRTNNWKNSRSSSNQVVDREPARFDDRFESDRQSNRRSRWGLNDGGDDTNGYRNRNNEHQWNQSDRSRNSQFVKRVPIHQWKIEYDGEYPPSSLIDFLKLVEAFRVSERMSDDDMVHGILHLLSGRARVWFLANSIGINSWLELVDKMKEEFCPRIMTTIYWIKSEIENRERVKILESTLLT